MPPSITEAMFYIYLIQNKINNKIYIGMTQNISSRWNTHMYAVKQTKKRFYLHNAINKYGKENFTLHELERFNTKSECITAEIFWISYFRSNDSNYGYNLTNGGEGTWGRKLSKSHKEKISTSLLGNKRAHGNKHSSNWKKEMSIKHTGELNGRARLCKQDVLFIRKFHAENINSDLDIFKCLSDKYGLSISGLEKIIYRKTWKHI